MNILIAVASKYGSSRSIAERLATVLEQGGHQVSVVNAARVKDVAPYDGVILGGGVYMGRLHGAIMRLARKQQSALAGKRVALFVVSLSVAQDDPESQAQVEMFGRPLQKLLSPESVANLPGMFDPDTMPWLARTMLTKLKVEPQDARDWEAVESWGAELAEAWR